MARILAGIFALALLLAACGGDDPALDDGAVDDGTIDDGTGDDTGDSADDGSADDTGDTGDTADDGAADDMAAAEAVVATAETEHGTVLVDGEGRALYLFDNDSDGTSACYDDCAANWPPLESAGAPTAGEGSDAAQLGTTERDDGTMQVTYAGSPLYYFAADSAPGDTNGHGVGGVWWLVAPDGSAVPEGGGE